MTTPRPLADRLADVRHKIEAGKVRTWADGFGRWHAAVPESYAFPMGVAKMAILIECQDRQAAPVRMPQVERAGSDDQGRAIYRESDEA